MLAGVYRGIGDIALQACAIPQPEASGIVVRVAVAGICGSDLKTYQHGGYVPAGIVLGHEFTGEVVAVGEGVAGIPIGARVTVNPIPALLGLRADGAFAEYVHVPDAIVGESIFCLPDHVDNVQGALIEPLAVALRGINQGSVGPESRAVILGLGTIGLCALLALQQRGVKQIIAVDRAGVRLDLAHSLGATVHALGSGDLGDSVHEAFGVRPGIDRQSGVDFVFDATGSDAALAEAVNLLRLGGELVIVGTYPGSVNVDLNQVVGKELRILGSVAYENEFAEACELVAQGLDVSGLVSHRFPLGQIQQAFEQSLRGDEAIKVLLEPVGAS